ncbi:MAG: hypothetical protein VX527_08830, partial [Planctomycetota bacterium]|nr:hypothetical protein [Planctomycetota bacterium]
TQTIRARNDTITSIPPIPYAYFNPDTASYEVANSRPILLDVSPADTITSSDITGTIQAPQPSGSDNLHNVAGGLLANYTGTDRLLADQGPPGTLWLLILLIAPPLFVAGITATRQGVRGHMGNPDRVRSRRAGRHALTLLESAGSAAEAQRGALVAEALCTYIADRTSQPPAGFMRGDAISTLKHCGINKQLASQVDGLIAQCEHLQYAGGSGAEISSMIDSAKTLIAQLDATSNWKMRHQGASS